ncbi:MAG TPA: 16S rRNA (cytosine(967)-C(5))-methyltransferase RsmB [Pyrinomonadaceae bacterium]|nr:16S rRNA (cytosine(967)-C(5))-methyltransferase RsmB [Pyrinomonadaceae bacterium]HMP65724.1 16S rRNA (cytosine(967)-C(5))-methyltransferase RsmB [Pyrinomonadaceae bacterium]
MSVSPARTAAYDILLAIEKVKGRSSELLPTRTKKLSDADRGLCYEIVLGVLRRRLYFERLILIAGGKRKLDAEVSTALQIGLFQLLFLDRVPAYSAVNESVELVARARKSSAKGFVNAVLRKIQREVPILEFADPLEEICITTSHPRWLVERWCRQFGTTRSKDICEANNRTPRLSFRLTKKGADRFGIGVSDRDETISNIQADAGTEIIKSELTDTGLLAERMTPGLRRLAAGGLVYFQDEASQLVANGISVPKSGRLLDVCAAPGGKTTLIAARESDRSGLFVAGELRWSRTELLARICKNQSVAAAIVQLDGENPPFSDAVFDIVLIDAPCSGTGTIRNNPEIRYRLTEPDIGELSDKQLKILKRASKCVKPGGELIYSTCSLEEDENELVVDQFLRENLDFCVLTVSAPARYLRSGEFVRTFPDLDATDGFFVARMVRAG